MTSTGGLPVMCDNGDQYCDNDMTSDKINSKK